MQIAHYHTPNRAFYISESQPVSRFTARCRALNILELCQRNISELGVYQKCWVKSKADAYWRCEIHFGSTFVSYFAKEIYPVSCAVTQVESGQYLEKSHRRKHPDEVTKWGQLGALALRHLWSCHILRESFLVAFCSHRLRNAQYPQYSYQTSASRVSRDGSLDMNWHNTFVLQFIVQPSQAESCLWIFAELNKFHTDGPVSGKTSEAFFLFCTQRQ